MKNIDFLPRQYQEQNASRKAHIWRAGVFLVFSGAIAAAALVQYALARSTERQLEKVEAAYAEALARQSQFNQAKQDLTAAEDAASLYAFLEHPWPRSRVLAEIVKPLPHEVTLLEIQLQQEPIRDAAGRLQQFSQQSEGEAAAAAPASPARDLQRLLSEAAAARSAIQLTGVTGDAAALHRFADALGSSRLFLSAELGTFESAPGHPVSEMMQFELRLVIRPGYGVPGGPHEELLAKAKAITENTEGNP